jgi:lipid A oxidase
MLKRVSLIGVLAGAVALAATAARAEWQFGAYGGWNGSFNSDVTFTDPDTDWTVSDVPWDGLSFFGDGGAPYYGLRATYWQPGQQGWGVMFDYTHAKVRALADATVSYNGTLDGSSYNGTGTIGGLFDVLEFTDGISLFTLNGMYRFQPVGIFQPYLGAGIGFNVPHVEVTGNSTGFPTTFMYHYGGFAAQVLAGVDVPITKHISVFGEYKLSWAGVSSPLTGGYHIDTDIITNHVLAGVSVRFGN